MKALLFLILAILQSACNGQADSATRSPVRKDSLVTAISANQTDSTDGIVYFSSDDGLNWGNKSQGLPLATSIGLGALAVSGTRLALATKVSGIYIFQKDRDIWISMPTDERIIKSNPAALIFYKDRIYVGTESSGVFSTADDGKSWTNLNTGLGNITIRKLAEIGGKLYAGTNGGLYSYNESQQKWIHEYGTRLLQVNGIAAFKGNIYIATNRGAYSSPMPEANWQEVLPNRALHNISSDDKVIYAMLYNELFSSSDKGLTWRSIQKGLPYELYTFNVLKEGQTVFAGQWDGVYRKELDENIWKWSGKGLPKKFAITNMQRYNGIIVITASESKLKPGMTLNK